jgi:hypothetical protein
MSQCDRLLEALSDGGWHTTAALHRDAGFMIVHSRIAELRARGHVVEHDHTGGVGAAAHRYRLVSGRSQTGGPGQQPVALVTREATAPSADQPEDPGRMFPGVEHTGGIHQAPPSPACGPEQLSLEVAA